MGITQRYSVEALADDLSALTYIVNTLIDNRVNTVDIVRVVAVSIELGTVDVLPIIKNVNPDKEPIMEVPIYGIRYIRWQSGTNAIKIDPKIGDVGIILTCKKDISSVSVGLVGNNSKYNPASSIYLGGIFGLNLPATQFVEFGENTINITGTGTITIEAPTVEVKTTTAKVTATTTDVTSTTTNITSETINLGGEGGKKVALDGDVVKNGNTVVGNVVASSATTNAL